MRPGWTTSSSELARQPRRQRTWYDDGQVAARRGRDRIARRGRADEPVARRAAAADAARRACAGTRPICTPTPTWPRRRRRCSWSDGYAGADEETWAAVGRVTRRLLSALGADEAWRTRSGPRPPSSSKLLAPWWTRIRPVAPASDGDSTSDLRPSDGADADRGRDRLRTARVAARAAGPARGPARRRRASRYEWDGGDLVVPADREGRWSPFSSGSGVPRDDEDDDDGGEARYRAIEELFAAGRPPGGRPGDEQRAAESYCASRKLPARRPRHGRSPWFRIMTQARIASQRDAIEECGLRDVRDGDYAGESRPPASPAVSSGFAPWYLSQPAWVSCWPPAPVPTGTRRRWWRSTRPPPRPAWSWCAWISRTARPAGRRRTGRPCSSQAVVDEAAQLAARVEPAGPGRPVDGRAHVLHGRGRRHCLPPGWC